MNNTLKDDTVPKVCETFKQETNLCRKNIKLFCEASFSHVLTEEKQMSDCKNWVCSCAKIRDIFKNVLCHLLLEGNGDVEAAKWNSGTIYFVI